jgi:1-acyl-sn-glycerol-3-phosphate acyltransferase
MLRGVATLILLAANLFFWGTLVLLVGVVKFAVHMTAPRSQLRTRLVLLLAAIASRWVAANSAIYDLMLPTHWDVEGIPDSVHAGGHYLIVSNHVSWVDILVLQRVFHGRAAFLRFFMKQQLIWMPIVGQACWILDFPFMKRYTPEYLLAHPEKRGTDLATTRRACQRYRFFAVAMINFLEGTRFSEAKRIAQQSPYRHLLRPRMGGIAFVLASFGDQLDEFIDVTLAYPGGETTMWQFVTGRLERISVRAQALAIPTEFCDAAITEAGPARERFKAWIESRWRAKDEVLSALTESPAAGSPADRKTARA